jgi:hypothetical protein
MQPRTGIRAFHRWIAVAFVATVAANFIAMPFGTPPGWITYAPLAPLTLLTLTGAYLFALTYRRGS